MKRKQGLFLFLFSLIMAGACGDDRLLNEAVANQAVGH